MKRLCCRQRCELVGNFESERRRSFGRMLSWIERLSMLMLWCKGWMQEFERMIDGVREGGCVTERLSRVIFASCACAAAEKAQPNRRLRHLTCNHSRALTSRWKLSKCTLLRRDCETASHDERHSACDATASSQRDGQDAKHTCSCNEGQAEKQRSKAKRSGQNLGLGRTSATPIEKKCSIRDTAAHSHTKRARFVVYQKALCMQNDGRLMRTPEVSLSQAFRTLMVKRRQRIGSRTNTAQ